MCIWVYVSTEVRRSHAVCRFCYFTSCACQNLSFVCKVFFFLSNFIENVVFIFAVFLVTESIVQLFCFGICYWFVVREGRNGNKERRIKFIKNNVSSSNKFWMLKLWLGVATWMMNLNHRQANISNQNSTLLVTAQNNIV